MISRISVNETPGTALMVEPLQMFLVGNMETINNPLMTAWLQAIGRQKQTCDIQTGTEMWTVADLFKKFPGLWKLKIYYRIEEVGNCTRPEPVESNPHFDTIYIYIYIWWIFVLSSLLHLDFSTGREGSGQKCCTYFSFIIFVVHPPPNPLSLVWPLLQYFVKATQCEAPPYVIPIVFLPPP
jgi:hypothetical protein